MRRNVAYLFPLLLLARAVSAQGSPSPATDSLAADVHLVAEPQVIGAGVISTPAEEFKETISPDSQMLMYTVTDHQFRHMTIVLSRRSGSHWGTPEVVPFSGTWRDGDPSFTPDGRSALFISNRPMPGDSAGMVRRDFNIWSVPRHPDGTWGDPIALGRNINTDGSEFAPSVAASGNLYFSRGDQMFVAIRSALYFFSTRFTPASVRAPRTERATYRQLQQEAAEVVFNGSRNLYQVDISSLRCP